MDEQLVDDEKQAGPMTGDQDGPGPAGADSGTGGRNSGPGRLLVAVYAVFALAAVSRAAVQLSTKFHEAPLAYVLSALSGLVYVVATVALARRGERWRRVALVTCTFELVGVIAVGTLSVLDQGDFPDATVWSGYGDGYGFIPLILPMIGLYWLRRTRRTGSRLDPAGP